MTDHPGLGARVRELRRQRALRQEDLVDDGISASYLSLIEADKRRPSESVLAKIAARLGTTSEFLVTGVTTDERQNLQLQLRTAQLLLSDGQALESERLFRHLLTADDESIASEAAWGVAAAREARGDLEGAIAAYESWLDRAAQSSTDVSSVRASIALSRCYREAGDLARAVDVAETALERLQSLGAAETDQALAITLTLAMAHVERGDAVRAKQLLVRVQGMAEAMGTPRERGAAYWNAAVLAADLDQRIDAVWLIDRAVALFGEGTDDRNLARLHNARAAIVMRAEPKRAGEALNELHTARDTLTEVGSSVDIAYCETEIARALVLVGNAAGGASVAREAMRRLGGPPRLESARARAALAYALAASGDVELARQEYTVAATTMTTLGARRQAAIVWLELAEMHQASGDLDASVTALQQALADAGLRPHFPAVRPRAKVREQPSSGRKKTAARSRTSSH